MSGIIIAIVSVIATRLLGAWMLRIDTVIKELKSINKKLDK